MGDPKLLYLVDLLNRDELKKYVDNVYVYAEYPFTAESRGELLWGDASQREEEGDDDYGLTEFGSVRECEEFLEGCEDDVECVIDSVMQVLSEEEGDEQE